MRSELVNLVLFFFQAEDGIRDGHVTGVQTCALPISPRPPRPRLLPDAAGLPGGAVAGPGLRGAAQLLPDRRARTAGLAPPRSEERRVGKEGRGEGWKWQDDKTIDRETRTRTREHTGK